MVGAGHPGKFREIFAKKIGQEFFGDEFLDASSRFRGAHQEVEELREELERARARTVRWYCPVGYDSFAQIFHLFVYNWEAGVVN